MVKQHAATWGNQQTFRRHIFARSWQIKDITCESLLRYFTSFTKVTATSIRYLAKWLSIWPNSCDFYSFPIKYLLDLYITFFVYFCIEFLKFYTCKTRDIILLQAKRCIVGISFGKKQFPPRRFLCFLFLSVLLFLSRCVILWVVCYS